MKYFDFNDNEITEAEYKSRVAAGKRFTMRGNRLIRQMSPATEEQRDKDEEEYKANNPGTLDDFKVKKINRVSERVSKRYSIYVDKHNLKKFRREQAGVDYTIPEAVTSYANALETFFDDFIVNRPSCGNLRSAILRFDSIFILVTNPLKEDIGGVIMV